MKPLLKSYGHLQLNLEWDMLLLMMVPFTWLLGEPHLLPGIFVKLDVTFRYSPGGNMMGSFSDNVLPLIQSSVDDAVEPETSDDNDVNDDTIGETDDEPNDETDMTEAGIDWADNSMTDLGPTQPISTEPINTNDGAVDSAITDGYEDGYGDEYNYGDFKVQFVSISMLLLTIAF